VRTSIIVTVILIGICFSIPNAKGTENAKEITGKEPIWGKTYTATYSGSGENYYFYAMYAHPGDNITLNVTVSNPYSQVWFGGYKSELNWGAMPLSTALENVIIVADETCIVHPPQTTPSTSRRPSSTLLILESGRYHT
jgi:hypothetical protein